MMAIRRSSHQRWRRTPRTLGGRGVWPSVFLGARGRPVSDERRGFGPFGAVAFVFAAALIYAAPLRIAGWAPPMPLLALPAVYVWAAARPGPASYSAAFATGLLHDVVTGGPLGVWALGFLAAAAAGVLQRAPLEGQAMAPVWASFGVAALAAGVVAGLAGALAIGATPTLGPLAAQLLVTLMVAPWAAQAAGGFEAAFRTPAGRS